MKIFTQTNVTFFTDLPGEFTSLRENLSGMKGIVVQDLKGSPAVLASAAKELAIISSVIPGDEGGRTETNSDLIFIEALTPNGNRISLTDELFGDNTSEVIKTISATYRQAGYSVKITRSKV